MTTSRAVLVTGASRGIGAATARAFAALGDRVAVHHGASVEAAAGVLASLPGDGHIGVQADLADPDATRAMVAAAADGLGGLDVVVNNAAVFVAHPIAEVDYETWQRAWSTTLAVDLVAVANVAWCARPHLAASGAGRMVNVGSRGAWRGEPEHPAYGAAKAGLASLGQSLAIALAPDGIAVTTVAPGWVHTDMAADRLAGEEGAARLAQSPLNRAATVEEVAAAIVYLASAPAGYATGAILDINGASHLRM